MGRQIFFCGVIRGTSLIGSFRPALLDPCPRNPLRSLLVVTLQQILFNIVQVTINILLYVETPPVLLTRYSLLQFAVVTSLLLFFTLTVWMNWTWKHLSIFIEFTFSFLEVHMIKIVSFAIMTFCCLNVNALHILIVIVLVLSLPMGPLLVAQAFRLIGIYLALLLLTKMIYQTRFVPKKILNINCTETDLPLQDRLKLLFMDLTWMGYQLLEKEESTVDLWGSYLLVLLAMTFHAVVYIRQRRLLDMKTPCASPSPCPHGGEKKEKDLSSYFSSSLKRLDDGKPGLLPLVLYPFITREKADESVSSCIKYLFNYGFYKFGIEVTLTTAAFVIAYRMDVISLFYALWLLVLFPLRRWGVSRMWPFFFASLTLSILWQYAMVVGLSPLVCLEYPWNVSQPLNRWLFLASYRDPPEGTKILVDFLLLILVWRQKTVFDIEKEDHSSNYPGGSNKEVFMEYYNPDFINPVPDQTAFNRSALDWLKNFVVTSMLWITLAFVYWTGVHNVNVLSLGYLVGAFIFLWIGYDLCLWNLQKILKWWNVLLAYTIMTITIKSMYEVAGCVYFNFLNENVCWLVQLLNLGCAHGKNEESSACVASKGTVMYWDAVCFGLILFQRRIFFSYYFLHQVDDIKAIVLLQSKGAQLIEQLMQQQITESENKKKKTLDKIKKTMKRIKEWQKKIHGLNYLEPMDHATAVHMGDYYMFEEAMELDTVVESSSSSDDERNGTGSKERVAEKDKELTMTQFIGTVFKRTTEDNVKAVRPGVRMKKKPEPGTSDGETDEGTDDREDDTASSRKEGPESDENENKETITSAEKEPKLRSAINFLTEFFESVCVSMIRFFDKHSKDYRYIDASMKEERKTTKEMKKSDSPTLPQNRSRQSQISGEGLRRNEDNTSKLIFHSGNIAEPRRKYDDQRSHGYGVYAQLIVSLSFFIMSHTEFFCYVIIFLHQALSPTILSLPLPLCVLLWGSLTTIRPTTTFWIVLIAYAEVTVLIKAMFQNWIFPWNSPDGNRHHPYHPPLLLGIHRNNTYATADLFLLFMLFLHRYKLKRLGLWKRTNEEETSSPRNLGIYYELLREKDDDDNVSGLERELESHGKANESRSIQMTPRLAKWKCTSRAMAALYTRKGKARTKLNVQEIEGHILVTHQGRRLKPTEGTIGRIPEGVYGGDVVLRVYASDQVSGSKNIYCKLSCLQHFTPVRKFFMQIMDQKGRLSADFYTLIFFFDFLTFLIVFFGFSHFTEIHVYNPEEHFYFAENQVPLSYLIAVLLHFIIIIIDRVLYLRKNVAGKLMLQITLVVIIHLWMFVILPKVTEASFTELTLPQIYYLIKCLYFLMSAYQMRVGYPLRVQGHFLCKKYGYINYLSYKGLQFIPFFNQLRTLLDYVCIHSSLSIMEWIKMESIFQLIFENKCARKADEEYPTKRGIMFPRCKKYVPGTSAFIFMVFVMWFPFFLFAIFETVSEPNQPKMGVLDLTMGTFDKVYSTTAAHESITPFKYADFDILKTLYKDNKKVWSFLSNYKFEDVAVLKFSFQPLESWKIRPDEFDRLNKIIQAREIPIHIYLTWTIFRTERAQIVATAYGTHEVMLEKTGYERDQFAKAFSGEGNKIFMKHMVPKFIQVNNEGNAIPISGFLSPRNRTNSFRNITLRLNISKKPNDIKHWELTELADDELEGSKISKIPYQDDKYITIYTFNEKNIPKPLLNISRRGIIGLYLSIVLVTWTVVKRFMCKYPNIMFEDMPNVDRILQLCHDIYLARESHEFALEEDLYAKLLFLFRSPETLIKWTRIKSPDEMALQPDN